MLTSSPTLLSPVLALLLSAVLLSPDCGHAQVDEPASAFAQSAIQSLDGQWQIVADVSDAGRTQRWFEPNFFPRVQAKPISVPGSSYQALPDYNGVLWYYKEFMPTVLTGAENRYYLRFDAVNIRVKSGSMARQSDLTKEQDRPSKSMSPARFLPAMSTGLSCGFSAQCRSSGRAAIRSRSTWAASTSM